MKQPVTVSFVLRATLAALLLVLGACDEGLPPEALQAAAAIGDDGASEPLESPAQDVMLGCEDFALTGPLPIELGAVNTSYDTDDFAPNGGEDGISDLALVWTPTETAEIRIELASNDPSAPTAGRELYVLSGCGGAIDFSGGIGSGTGGLVEAGTPVVIIVQGCEGDCVLRIR